MKTRVLAFISSILLAFPLDAALHFDVAACGATCGSTTQYISIPTEGNFDFEYTHPFSISVWIYPTDVGGLQRTIVSKLNASSPFDGWEFVLLRGGNGDGVTWYLINNAAVGGKYIDVNTPIGSIAANIPQHVCGTYSGSGTAAGVKIYINGALQTLTVNTDGLAGNSILNNQSLRIGTRNDQSRNFVGYMGDLAIYPFELSAGQCQTLAGGANIGVPRARWRMDEGTDGTGAGDGTSATVRDITGNGNSGTPKVNPKWKAVNWIKYP